MFEGLNALYNFQSREVWYFQNNFCIFSDGSSLVDNLQPLF